MTLKLQNKINISWTGAVILQAGAVNTAILKDPIARRYTRNLQLEHRSEIRGTPYCLIAAER